MTDWPQILRELSVQKLVNNVEISVTVSTFLHTPIYILGTALRAVGRDNHQRPRGNAVTGIFQSRERGFVKLEREGRGSVTRGQSGLQGRHRSSPVPRSDGWLRRAANEWAKGVLCLLSSGFTKGLI